MSDVYDGEITVIGLRTGPQIAVQGDPNEVSTILEQSKSRNKHFAIFKGLDGDAIGIPWADVGLFSVGQKKANSPIEVPQRQLLVPNSVN